MNSYQIEVTQRMIDHCRRNSPAECAVANAIHFATGIEDIVVDERHAHVPGCELVKLPSDVTEWIDRYDEFEPVEPITFMITLWPDRSEQGDLARAG